MEKIEKQKTDRFYSDLYEKEKQDDLQQKRDIKKNTFHFLNKEWKDSLKNKEILKENEKKEQEQDKIDLEKNF